MSDMNLIYLKKILEVNQRINLTNIKNIEDGKLLHIEDSLAALPEINDAPEGLYADIGSGGGFPGVPLALATNRTTYLIDSVSKKMKAVESVLSELQLLDSIQTYGMRIEEFSIEMPERFAVITARALTSLPSLVELASPLLKQDGHLVCLKSHIQDEEINHAVAIEDKTGMTLYSRRSYLLSDNETYREVIVFKKSKQPAIDLPRRIGLAQKRPLKAD